MLDLPSAIILSVYQPRLLKAVINSLILATGVGVMSVALGVPMSWAVTRINMPLRGVVKILLLLAFTTPLPRWHCLDSVGCAQFRLAQPGFCASDRSRSRTI
jgi:hypothetical protein